MPTYDEELTARLRRFGELVRDARLAAELSQEDLAHQSGLHRTYVGSVERGERNISLASAFALSDALDVTLSELLRS